MKTKQLLLELLLLNEKYSIEEIEAVKELLSKKDIQLYECLVGLNRLTNSNVDEVPKMQNSTPKGTNLKKLINDLRKTDEIKHKLIKQIQELLQDTKMMTLQEIRSYANQLAIPFDRSSKRTTLIRGILIHLTNLPIDQIRIPAVSMKNKKVNQLEIISEAILAKNRK